MCVIILRQPGVSIPFEKIQSACTVNPDGWGFAIADRGKLTITKGVSEQTDPEFIAKVLEDAKDQHLMLHLRYVTVGERNDDNCHPFQITNENSHGIDIAFSHNGTLYSWKRDKSAFSDTYHFAHEFVQPLFHRAITFNQFGTTFDDEFVQKLLEKEAGASSLFGLIDGNGKMLAINYDHGVQHEGWWSSNEYSFNVRHREKSTTYTTGSYSYANYDGYDAWGDDSYYTKYGTNSSANVCHLPTRTGTSIKGIDFDQNSLPFDDPGYDPLEPTETEAEAVEELLKQGETITEMFNKMPEKINAKLVNALLAQKRLTFTEITKIGKLEELCRLSPEDLAEMCAFYPEATVVLIQDLLYTLYLRDKMKEKQQAESNAA